VSSYFLSQLAAVLFEDDLFTLTEYQKGVVESTLRKGKVFRSVAEKHKTQYHSRQSIGHVALAKLKERKQSQWSPDLLVKQFSRIENEYIDTLEPNNSVQEKAP
jgi:hypothetical protein